MISALGKPTQQYLLTCVTWVAISHLPGTRSAACRWHKSNQPSPFANKGPHRMSVGTQKSKSQVYECLGSCKCDCTQREQRVGWRTDENTQRLSHSYTTARKINSAPRLGGATGTTCIVQWVCMCVRPPSIATAVHAREGARLYISFIRSTPPPLLLCGRARKAPKIGHRLFVRSDSLAKRCNLLYINLYDVC